jgi:CelD/BcsL family acetyltransferase involved in cellulose biosynthesis
MQVEIIDDHRDFQAIRDNWNAVYDADPEAQFFLSSAFLADWLPRLGSPWFILAARPAAGRDHVAFLPLRLRIKERKGGGFYNEINMAGNYCADYTGLICRPEVEAQAIPALARQISRLHWTRLNLDNMALSEKRMSLLLAPFRGKSFTTEELARVNAQDGIDNCICPSVDLPNDWEQYLKERVSTNSRQKIRRLLRQVEAGGEFRITLADTASIDRDIRILLGFWSARWATRKGTRLQQLLENNYVTLRQAFAGDVLLLPVLWRNDEPLAALATFIDRSKRSLLFYIGGRDESFDALSPGFVLHAFSIRHAIAQGFERYDFLRGNESYKYSFGAAEQRIKCIRVSTRNGRNLGDRLDDPCLAEVLRRTTELHQAGKLAEAERGYRQILDVNPHEPTALYRFGQLLATRGKLVGARKTFKTLSAVRPDSYKAWLGFAQALHALHRFAEAVQAYQEAIRLRPELALAHRNLGQLLMTLGRHADAAAAFRTALQLRSDDRISENGLALANKMLAQLFHKDPEGPLARPVNGVAELWQPSHSVH